mmetsp:Transcript_18702/g.28002  ORF Transcript_18702/g.28002 Transcript_18702/m.28002 type:complete len:211 (-) Transcript_18702:2746-3378(-)
MDSRGDGSHTRLFFVFFPFFPFISSDSNFFKRLSSSFASVSDRISLLTAHFALGAITTRVCVFDSVLVSPAFPPILLRNAAIFFARAPNPKPPPRPPLIVPEDEACDGAAAGIFRLRKRANMLLLPPARPAAAAAAAPLVFGPERLRLISSFEGNRIEGSISLEAPFLADDAAEFLSSCLRARRVRCTLGRRPQSRSIFSPKGSNGVNVG